MLLLLALALSVTSAFAMIPPWNATCIQQSIIPNACVYGNLSVTLTKKMMTLQDCNSHVSITEFEHTPVIHLDTKNNTDTFTVVMIDLGPDGRGPNYLQWMVTNVTVSSLPLYNHIPQLNVLEAYNKPLLMKYVSHRTLIQILVIRHNNVLRVPFGELWVKQTRNFSLSTLFSNVSPTLKLCGPVAGTQYWVYDPSAPPLPGVADQHPPKTLHKPSSASTLQPLQVMFIPIVVLTYTWL